VEEKTALVRRKKRRCELVEIRKAGQKKEFQTDGARTEKRGKRQSKKEDRRGGAEPCKGNGRRRT